MNIVFLDRSADRPTTGLPFLTVQPAGNFALSSGAVVHHQLQEQQWVSLAHDTDSNTYYLVFGPGTPERKPFKLWASKDKAASRQFSATGPAKKLLAAYPLAPEAKSLRLLIGTPVTHEAIQLYPLRPEGQPEPVAPVVSQAPPTATPEATVAEPAVSATAPETTPASAPAGFSELQLTVLAKLRTGAAPTALVKGGIPGYNGTKLAEWRKDAAFLEAYEAAKMEGWKKLNPDENPDESAPAAPAAPALTAESQEPATTALAPAPAPAPASEQQPAPRKTFGLLARAEELTEHWKERDLSKATPNELGEILNLLSHVARDKRTIEMGLLLDRATVEQTNRFRNGGREQRRG